MFIAAKHCQCFCSSVRSRRITSRRSSACPSPLFQFGGVFHTRRLTCNQSPKCYSIGFCWRFYELFVQVLNCLTCDEAIWTLTIFNWSFPTFPSIKPVKAQCSIHYCHRKIFWACRICDPVFPSLMRSLAHMHYSFKSAIRRYRTEQAQNIKPLRTRVRGYGCKTH